MSSKQFNKKKIISGQSNLDQVPATKFNRDPKFFFPANHAEKSNKTSEAEAWPEYNRRKSNWLDIHPGTLILFVILIIFLSLMTSFVFLSYFAPKVLPAFLTEAPQSRKPLINRASFRSVADDILPSVITISQPSADVLGSCMSQANITIGKNLNLNELNVTKSTACPYAKQSFFAQAIIISPDGWVLTSKPTETKNLKAESFIAWDQNGKPYPIENVLVSGSVLVFKVTGLSNLQPVNPRIGALNSGETLTVIERAAFDKNLPSQFNSRYLSSFNYSGRYQKIANEVDFQLFNFIDADNWRPGSVLVDDEGYFVGLVTAQKNTNNTNLHEVVISDNWPKVWQNLLVPKK